MEGSIAVEGTGTVLAGRYRVERKVGTGGMGTVYRAVDLTSDEPVAIKVLDKKKDLPALEQRFAREIAAVKRLRSPHAVRLIDAGVLEDGSHYMAMEFLEGADLQHILNESVTLAPARAVRLVMQACSALAEAHSMGIVHRDLKPANLFVTRLGDGSECLKVLDFGISKLPQATMDDMALTGTGTVLGSPVYMSPEQMTSSKSVDARSDVWALGIVLYQCLSGGFPYDAEALPELCARVLTTDPLALSAQMAVAPGLEAAVMRCLARNPARRFARVEDLAAALAPFAAENVSPPTIIALPPSAPPAIAPSASPVRRPLPLPPPPPTPTPTPRPDPVPTPPAVFREPDSDPARRGRRIRLTGAAIGFVAGVVYLVVTWPRPAPDAPAPPPAPVPVAAPAAAREPVRAAAADTPAPPPAPARKPRKARRGAPPERGAFDSPLPP
ncbi:MAG TPA: serine/threonine-protein kinase [Kofleriaceae bacterium]|nr:serine/threonine-protein kinase [Kofleriaceae bacterium]